MMKQNIRNVTLVKLREAREVLQQKNKMNLRKLILN